jgi:S-adenosyl-L-methionine hydrolase (adenosine-forming)
MPIITLLSDFGLRDHFVGAVKGVMLSLNPEIMFVDITHQIPPQDIFSGAFALGQAYAYFPSGTIHFAVVDPGVGTSRKVLAASAAGHFFVAPDNGILTYVIQENADFVAHEVTADHYFRKPVSATFHGRDIFAPIAAWISRKIELHQFGPRVETPVRLNIPFPKHLKETLLQGMILAVDYFGNLITNVKPSDVTSSFKILAGQREIATVRTTYGAGAPGEVFMVLGSTGYYEIVVKGGSAAATLNLKPGAPIGLVLQPK